MKRGFNMKKYEFIKLATEKKEKGFLKITLNDGYTCVLGSGEKFMIGWEEEVWGCDLLGLLPFNSFDEVLQATADYIYNELVTWKDQAGQWVEKIEVLKM